MRILVTKRTADFHACVENQTEVWGCGKNVDEALGGLIRAHQDIFKITICNADESTGVAKDSNPLLHLDVMEFFSKERFAALRIPSGVIVRARNAVIRMSDEDPLTKERGLNLKTMSIFLTRYRDSLYFSALSNVGRKTVNAIVQVLKSANMPFNYD